MIFGSFLPLFEDHIADTPEYEAEGYWESLSEAVFLMYRTVALFSDHGKTVVIDSMLLGSAAFAPHYARMAEIFRAHPLLDRRIHPNSKTAGANSRRNFF